MSKRIHPSTIIEGEVSIHPSVKVGPFCHITGPVTIGEGTEIKSYVEIRANTTIGKNCMIDSRVSFSGESTIGDNVTLRYGTIIARGCTVEDGCYLAPRVMTNNLDSEGNTIGGARIKAGTFIGTHTVLHHGITVGPKAVVGACSFVNRDIGEGIWMGVPAKRK